MSIKLESRKAGEARLEEEKSKTMRANRLEVAQCKVAEARGAQEPFISFRHSGIQALVARAVHADALECLS